MCFQTHSGNFQTHSGNFQTESGNFQNESGFFQTESGFFGTFLACFWFFAQFFGSKPSFLGSAPIVSLLPRLGMEKKGPILAHNRQEKVHYYIEEKEFYGKCIKYCTPALYTACWLTRVNLETQL